jgi:hypothetical protein
LATFTRAQATAAASRSVDKDENVWETEIEWAGRTVRAVLWFDGAMMNSSVLESIVRFATDVAGFDQLARLAMREDWTEKGSEVRAYMEHHFDDLGADERRAALGTADRKPSTWIRFFLGYTSSVSGSIQTHLIGAQSLTTPSAGN